MQLLTIGHSTRSTAEFISLLQNSGVRQLADVRTVPRSRHNPQFNRDTFTETLQEQGIEYLHYKDLGGLRKTHQDSINQGWRNASFRGYADYMQTDEFVSALDDLLAWAEVAPTAVMCAEAVPWRCHRSLIGDAALVRGVTVCDIMGEDKEGNNKLAEHKLTSFAQVDGLTITYPFALE